LSVQLSSDIWIDRSPPEVWSFLGEPANTALWDRGVGGVEEKSSGVEGVGVEFETVAHDRLNLPDQGRMSYRVSEVDPTAGRCVVELTSKTGNARFFRSAAWHFQVQPEGAGSRLTCTAVFTLRFLYLFLAPLLYLKRKAILLDLTLLKRAVEAQPV
jgi:Polyketide cyclase / dehydrase and lipid transport